MFRYRTTTESADWEPTTLYSARHQRTFTEPPALERDLNAGAANGWRVVSVVALPNDPLLVGVVWEQQVCDCDS